MEIESTFIIKNDTENVAIPAPEPSTPGHTQSFGGELLTWTREGAIAGFMIGMIAGLCFYLLVNMHFILIPALDPVRASAPFLFAIMIFLLSAIMGAGAGAVVGIGTPKFNPHPEQGWVRSWQLFILRRKNQEKEIRMPKFKNSDIESHRQSQRG